jgi:hypothetical protein
VDLVPALAVARARITDVVGFTSARRRRRSRRHDAEAGR